MFFLQFNKFTQCFTVASQPGEPSPFPWLLMQYLCSPVRAFCIQFILTLWRGETIQNLANQ